MLVRVLWAGRYGRGAVDRSDALAAEVLVRALLARVLLCVLLVIGVDQAPVEEPVPMSVGDLEQAPVTQVTQVTQVDAGDAGDRGQ